MTASSKRPFIQRLKNDFIFHGARALIAFATAIPLHIGIRIGRAIGRAAFTILRRDRAKVLRHVKIAFPDSSPEWRVDVGRASFENLGRGFFELFHLEEIFAGKVSPVPYCRIEGREHFDAALAEGRGALLMTAHVGNWELMAAYIAHVGFPMNEIVRSLYDERIDNLLNDHRRKYGYIPIARGGGDAMKEIADVVARNGLLAILMDQDTRVRGVFAPFLGPLAHTPTGPAFLAYSLNIPVVTLFNHRGPDGGLVIEIGPPIDLPRTGDANADVAEATRIFNDRISEHIRRFPAQWVWMHERWKKRPPGEPEHLRPAPPAPPGAVTKGLILRLATRAACALSSNGADAMGGWLGRASYALSPRRSRLATQNLEIALGRERTGPEIAQIVKRSVENRGRNATDCLRARLLDTTYLKERVEVVGEEHLRASLADGRGAILICGHIGSIDLGLWALSTSGLPIALVERKLGDRFLWHWVRRVRARFGVATWTAEEAAESAPVWLAKNGCVAWSIDRAVPRERAVLVRFFDRHVSTDRTPAGLAVEHGAPIHICYSLRIAPGRHRMVIEPALPRPASVADASDDAIREITQSINSRWQTVIETYPDQWIWGHDRFTVGPDRS
ncbi:MAG: hypothetical protein IT350_13785 [Deltaproteobacteria bacterium]|nr:hypothetical protein [Deltaproteobacteria bacterium]